MFFDFQIFVGFPDILPLFFFLIYFFCDQKILATLEIRKYLIQNVGIIKTNYF